MTYKNVLTVLRHATGIRTEAEEFERGQKTAKEFLAGNPSRDEIRNWWSHACEDADMDTKPAYAKGAKLVLRPAWQSIKTS